METTEVNFIKKFSFIYIGKPVAIKERQAI